jgi:aminoglycoside phosphotransferase (APT) family kinase protein
LPRAHWKDLPLEARQAFEAEFGRVCDATSAPDGLTLGVATRLDTSGGRFFLKAAPTTDSFAGLYRRETIVGRLLPPAVPSPQLLWTASIGGWTILVFTYVDGQPVDFSPASQDPRQVFETIADLQARLTPCPWPRAPAVAGKIGALHGKALALLRDPARDAAKLTECVSAVESFNVEQLDGSTMLHADLHPGNFLRTDAGLHVVDWSLAARGAGWVDIAEALATAVPSWRSAPESAVTSLAAVRALFWEYEARNGPIRLRSQRAYAAKAAHVWLRHRTT